MTTIGKLLIATAMSFTMVSAASAYTQEQADKCTNDAFRICSSEIPDIERTTACMIRNKSQLSPGCRAVMDADAKAAASAKPVSAKPGKPVSLAPTKRAGV